MTEDFTLEQTIIEKRKRMEKLVARHNHLFSMVPKSFSEDVKPEFTMTLIEIDRNMTELLAVVAELESDYRKSRYYSTRQQLAER